jgi:hypothetical protein
LLLARYVGRYVRDLRNGEGTLRWPNGDTFVGVWKNGGRSGLCFFESCGCVVLCFAKEVVHNKQDPASSRTTPPKCPSNNCGKKKKRSSTQSSSHKETHFC